MNRINYHPDDPFTMSCSTYGISTGFITRFHYMIIQHDAPKGDPWLLYML